MSVAAVARTSCSVTLAGKRLKLIGVTCKLCIATGDADIFSRRVRVHVLFDRSDIVSTFRDVAVVILIRNDYLDFEQAIQPGELVAHFPFMTLPPPPMF